MADWQFKSARLVHTVVTLEFQPAGGGHSLSLAIQLENANQLTAGLLNVLKAAREQGQNFPAMQFGEQQIELTVLPVDRWQVAESPDLPGLALLHLLAAGGLSLTYSFGTDATRFVGEALSATARDTPNTTPN